MNDFCSCELCNFDKGLLVERRVSEIKMSDDQRMKELMDKIRGQYQKVTSTSALATTKASGR